MKLFTKKDEALKMAIEALDLANGARIIEGIVLDNSYEINACKEALEQPAQEPVAWMYTKKGDYGYTEDSVEATTSENYAINLSITPVIPLYTHPHQCKKLTNDRIREIGDNCLENNNGLFNWIDFARAIEKELKY